MLKLEDLRPGLPLDGLEPSVVANRVHAHDSVVDGLGMNKTKDFMAQSDQSTI
jgi:hypothetical protein